MLLQTVSLTLLIYLSQSQSCLDQNGNSVSWWVQLIFPGSVPGGYAYIDNTYTAPSFTI